MANKKESKGKISVSNVSVKSVSKSILIIMSHDQGTVDILKAIRELMYPSTLLK